MLNRPFPEVVFITVDDSITYRVALLLQNLFSKMRTRVVMVGYKIKQSGTSVYIVWARVTYFIMLAGNMIFNIQYEE